MNNSAEIYADPTRFAAWLEKAGPGESFLYAIAGALDRAQPVVIAVALASEIGAVVPVMGGREGERRFQVQRCGRPSTARTASSTAQDERGSDRLPRLNPIFAAKPEGRLFALLCELAEAGQPCPSDAVLARRLAWDREQVRYRRGRLVTSGHIAVRKLGDGRFDGRVITILETGARTAEPGHPSGARRGAERGTRRA